MEFSGFTLIVTEECNFNCPYCYQKKGKRHLDASIIEKAIDFFFSFLTEESFINFYGGEPLLAFDQIRHAVNYIQYKNKKEKKQIRYSITTNGSLLDDDILQFLDQHKFSVLLSFDGYAQETYRKKGSLDQIVSIIKKIIRKTDIALETNSVFTPKTIKYLSKSIRFIAELGVPEIDFSLCKISQWSTPSLLKFKKELSTLRNFLLSHYKKEGNIPLVDFRPNSRKEVFFCFAGRDRMSLAPDGKLWGCCLFPDFFKGYEEKGEYEKYCFGDLDSFIEDYKRIYPEILSNFSNLRTDHFYTSSHFCILCDELEECGVCPIDTTFSGRITRRIPQWKCEIKKIFRKEKKLFWRELES